LETNGLLPDVNKLHCICIHDLDTQENWACADAPYADTSIADGLKLLSEASMLVAHNGLSYDYPVLKHLIPGWDTAAVIRDTLVLSKMVFPTDKLKELDYPRWRKGVLPGNLIGAHKLEAWGMRLGQMKGDYSDTVKGWSKRLSSGEITVAEVPRDFHCLRTDDNKLDPWLSLNQPMLDYCSQDVRVTVEFFRLLEGHLTGTSKPSQGVAWTPRSVYLEHRMWEFCDDIKARGFGYDLKGGVKLAAKLKDRKTELERDIRGGFGSWWQPLSDAETGELPGVNRSVVHLVDGEPLPDVTIPRYGKNGKELAPYVGPPKAHYSVDAPFVKIERLQLNPGSPKQLGDRLMAVFGWQPTDWCGLKDENGKGTQAKLDETVLKELQDSILPTALKEQLLEFMVVKKTLGALADGKKAWNHLVAQDQRLHGRIDPLGTVSNRGAHSDPNLGNVTAVEVDEVKNEAGEVVTKTPILGWRGGFGVECRSLFMPGIRTALGKPGFKCQTGVDASGLQLRCLAHYLFKYDNGEFAKRVSTPGVDVHRENAKIADLSRDEAKTWIYAWLFGAGALKLGIALGVAPELVELYANSSSAKSYDRFLRKVQGANYTPLDQLSLAYVGRGSEVAKKFVDAIVGLKDLKDDIKKEAEQYGFILGLDGRKLHIRKPHAALNQALQGAEAIICKEWGLETDRLLREVHGLHRDRDYGVLGWIHDEYQYEHGDGLQPVIAEVAQQAMENVAEMLDFKCPLGAEAKHGTNWYSCH